MIVTQLPYSGKFRMVLIFACAFCTRNQKLRTIEFLRELWPRFTRWRSWLMIQTAIECQILERPTHRTLDQSYDRNRSKKRLIILERYRHAVLQAIGELHGRGLVALACEIKTYENLFCGFLARYAKIYTNENFPLYGIYLWNCCTVKLLWFWLHINCKSVFYLQELHDELRELSCCAAAY